MPGKHRFNTAAAMLAIGFGWLIWPGGPISAAELPVLGDLPFHITVPAQGHHGSTFSVHTWPFGHGLSPNLKGDGATNNPHGGIYRESYAYNESFALSYANLSSKPKHLWRHHKGYMHYPHTDIAPVPTPGAVWLFLSALALLLFGISRRHFEARG